MTAAEGTARWQAVEQVRAFVQEVGSDYDALPEGVLPRPDTLAALSLLEQALDEADRALMEYEHSGDITDGTFVALDEKLAAVRSGRAGA